MDDRGGVRERARDAAKAILPGQTKKMIRMAGVRFNSLVLPGLRPLPSLIIVGAMRAGTTSMYKHLAAHPQLSPSVRKETEYFTRHWSRGEDWYRGHFGLSFANERVVAFEATPDYLFHPWAPRRASRVVPNAHIVAILREPIARARSHHAHMVRLGFENLPFIDALMREEDRLGDVVAALEGDPFADRRELLRYSYLARGCYASQLRRWLNFFPPEQIAIHWSEHYYSSPKTVLSEVAAAVRVPDHEWGSMHRKYAGYHSRAVPKVPSTEGPLRLPGGLAERIRAENQQLSSLLRAYFPDVQRPSWLFCQ